MTDDHLPDPSGDDGSLEDGVMDERDETLAAHLAVPPLDDLSRRRLVRGALDDAGASAPRRTRPARWLAAAAAVVIVAGVAWLALRGGSDDHPSAAGSPAPTSSTPGTTGPGTPSGAGSDAAQPNEAFAGNSPTSAADLGDLGEVADPGTLRTRVADATALRKSASPAAGPCAAALASDHAGLGPVVATGRATFHGRPASVFVTTSRAGERVAVVVLDAGCTVEAPVPLSR
jgi:hypothetical protein